MFATQINSKQEVVWRFTGTYKLIKDSYAEANPNPQLYPLRPDWSVPNVFTEDVTINNTYTVLNADPERGDKIY